MQGCGEETPHAILRALDRQERLQVNLNERMRVSANGTSDMRRIHLLWRHITTVILDSSSTPALALNARTGPADIDHLHLGFADNFCRG